MKPNQALTAAWFLVALAMPPPVSAQAPGVRLSVDPTMVRGSMTAPVTIVEFSDYQ